MSVLPHPKRTHKPDWVLLADFATGRHELRDDRRRWLPERLRDRTRRQHVWVHLRGLASRLGGVAENQQLSMRRALAVRDYMLQDVGVDASQITGLRACDFGAPFLA